MLPVNTSINASFSHRMCLSAYHMIDSRKAHQTVNQAGAGLLVSYLRVSISVDLIWLYRFFFWSSANTEASDNCNQESHGWLQFHSLEKELFSERE